jgi:hypothetical protein
MLVSIPNRKNGDDEKKQNGKEEDSSIPSRMLFLHAVRDPDRPLLLLA